MARRRLQNDKRLGVQELLKCLGDDEFQHLLRELVVYEHASGVSVMAGRTLSKRADSCTLQNAKDELVSTLNDLIDCEADKDPLLLSKRPPETLELLEDAAEHRGTYASIRERLRARVEAEVESIKMVGVEEVKKRLCISLRTIKAQMKVGAGLKGEAVSLSQMVIQS